MIVKLRTEHHLEFLSLKGGCRGSSESTHVKMPQCWKSHVMAYMVYIFRNDKQILFKVSSLKVWLKARRKERNKIVGFINKF